MHARSLCPFLSVALVWLATAAAYADSLPEEACEAVGAEHAKLTEAGLPDLVKKGPEWVKANLGEQRMEEVARYIRLREDLLFKCGHDKLLAFRGLEGEDAADSRTSAADAPPLPQRKPPVPESFKSRAIPAAAGIADHGAAPARVRPKPRRKPKVDDAYRPPPKAAAPQ